LWQRMTRSLAPIRRAKARSFGLTKSVVLQYGPRNIRINAVSPGPIRTRLTDQYPEESARTAAGVSMRRMGEPEEAGRVVGFLLSAAASFVAGAEIVVDGRQLAG